MFKYMQLYRQWLSRRRGDEICDREKGAGYYITLGLLFHDPVGKTQVWEMKSGKKMIAKLLSYRGCGDPPDMVRSSKWQYIGYEGETPFAEMTWREYLAVHKA